MDIILKRATSTRLSVRNLADSTDADISALAGIFSGNVSAPTYTGGSVTLTGDLQTSGTLKLVNGNTATITTSALAANRAIAFPDPLGAANLTLSTGTLNANGALYTDGTTIKSTATGGSGTRYLTSLAGAAPTYTALPTSLGFGGDGLDGAIVIGANTTDAVPKQRNATTFAISDTFTLTVISGAVINTTSTCTVGGGASGILTLVAGGGGAGGAADTGSGIQSTDGHGESGGAATAYLSGGTAWGGGGGGNGAAGGLGGTAAGGLAVAFARCGSGGGGGQSATGFGGAGGAGGGRISLCSVGAISIAAGAVFSNPGVAGGDSPSGAGFTSGGGGGGSGGTTIIASQVSITNSGVISAVGGAGGASGTVAGYGGGGGGGGRVVLWAPSITAGTITLTGGAAGVGVTANGTTGFTSTAYSVTGTPNLPLIGWLQNNTDKLANLPSETTNRDLALLAANGDLVKYLTYISGSLTETCEAIGNSDALANVA